MLKDVMSLKFLHVRFEKLIIELDDSTEKETSVGELDILKVKRLSHFITFEDVHGVGGGHQGE